MSTWTASPRPIRRYRLPSRSGARYEWAGTRRRGSPGVPSPCRSAASPRCAGIGGCRTATASEPVFATGHGTELLAGNVRRTFRRITRRAGLGEGWTPRELRHSFVSLLSDSGVRLEDIADLCGHSGTSVTERVYRHQLRPVLLDGAVAMDRIFDAGEKGKPAA